MMFSVHTGGRIVISGPKSACFRPLLPISVNFDRHVSTGYFDRSVARVVTRSMISIEAVCRTRMKNAALFALGFLFASFWLADSARCQTSLAPPLSLAPPPLTDKGSAPSTTTNNVWSPMAAPNVSLPRAATKSSAPSATINVGPPSTTDGVPPPAATAKRSVQPVPLTDAPRRTIATEAPATATVRDTPPTASDDVSSTPVIGRLPPSPKPAADYDGFSVGIVDDGDTSGQTTRPVRSRSAKQSKLSQEPDSIAAQKSVDQAEDEKLKRKLTICRGCK
jgi:hypothetical protein